MQINAKKDYAIIIEFLQGLNKKLLYFIDSKDCNLMDLLNRKKADNSPILYSAILLKAYQESFKYYPNFLIEIEYKERKEFPKRTYNQLNSLGLTGQSLILKMRILKLSLCTRHLLHKW